MWIRPDSGIRITIPAHGRGHGTLRHITTRGVIIHGAGIVDGVPRGHGGRRGRGLRVGVRHGDGLPRGDRHGAGDRRGAIVRVVRPGLARHVLCALELIVRVRDIAPVR